MTASKFNRLSTRLTITALFLVLSASAFGYGFFDYFDGSIIRTEHWSSTSNISWKLNDQTPQFQSASAASFTAWENVSYTNVTFQYDGLTPIVFDADDGTNLVSFAAPYLFFRQGVLGFTVNYITNSTGVIDGSDIIMSDKAKWSTDGTPKRQEYELGAVLTHEIGHHQGLAHSVVAVATMYPFISKSDASPATLEHDDLISHALQYNNGSFPGSDYSTISGNVTRGGTGANVAGACIHSFPPSAEFYADNITNTFTYSPGTYTLYVPSNTSYLLRVDPLDGSPSAFSPNRINSVLIAIAETDFPAEWWNSGDNNCEDNTLATSVAIGAGVDLVGFDFVTNENCGGGEQDILHVASISVTKLAGKGNRFRGVATVTIENQSGAGVSGATVTGDFELDDSPKDTKSGTTDANGEVTIKAKWVKNGSGDWCFEVTNVSLSGAVYNATGNAVTKVCESGVVFATEGNTQDTPLEILPSKFVLGQNHPNPFNPSTNISFTLPEASYITLKVYNIRGQRISTIAEGEFTSGQHTLTWDGMGYSSGVYFYRLLTEKFVQTNKMLLLK